MRKLALTMCLALSLSSVAPVQPLYAAELDQSAAAKEETSEDVTEEALEEVTDDVASDSDSTSSSDINLDVHDDVDREGVVSSGTDGGYKWNIDEDGKLTIEDGIDNPNVEAKYRWNLSMISNRFSSLHRSTDPFWNSIKSIDINVSRIDTCSSICHNFPNLESVKVNVGSGNVNDLLSGCKATNIDLSDWDTSEITTMANLFSSCVNVETLDVSKFNTSNVMSMDSMFRGCKKLKEINVSSFDTSKVYSMAFMFSICESLEYVNISNFDTSNVKTSNTMNSGVNYMFSDSTALKNVKLCTINAQNIDSIVNMFNNCTNLESIDMTITKNDKLTVFQAIFDGCKNLKNVNINMDTSKIKGMNRLFYNCESLESIDMSSWDLSSLNGAYFMLDNCTALSEVKAPKHVNVDIRLPNYYWWEITDDRKVYRTDYIPKNLSKSIPLYKNKFVGVVDFISEFKCGNTVEVVRNGKLSTADGCKDTFTWYVDDVPDPYYKSGYYQIKAEDYGKNIRVEITCSKLPGVVKSVGEHIVEYNDPPKWDFNAKAFDGRIRFSWVKYNAIPKYIVYRKIGNGEFEQIAVTKYSWYDDEDVVNGTTYTYAVRGVSEDGLFMTEIDPVTQKITYYSPDFRLAAPKLNKVVCTATGASVTWNEVADSKLYRVYKKNEEGVWEKLADTESTSYVDSDVAYNKEYAYTVSCVTVDGERELSDYDENGVTVTYKLATPVLSKVSSTATGAKVNWTAVEGAKTYRVFRKTPTGKWEKLGDTTKTAYTDKTAVNGKTYAYTVRCLSTTAQYISEYDKTGLTITYVNPDVTLANPVLKSVKNVSDGVSFAWNSTDGAVSYKVFRKEPGGSWKALGTTTKTTYTDKTVESGKTYVYTVRCVAEDGKTYMSAYDKTGLTIMYLAMPAVKVAKTTDGIKVSYGKIAGAKKYNIYRKTGDESWTKIATTTSTSYVDKTAKTKTTYYYTVKAVSDSYTSAYTSSDAIKR